MIKSLIMQIESELKRAEPSEAKTEYDYWYLRGKYEAFLYLLKSLEEVEG